MRRDGVVEKINPQRGMIAIATDDGFTIIELLSDFKLEVGDKVSWLNGFGLDHEVYENLTKKTKEEVYVQNHSVNKTNLDKQLLL